MKILKHLPLSSSFAAILLSACSSANADEWFKQQQLEGYVSQSIIYSSNHNFMSRSDDAASLDMWEAGAVLNSHVYEQLSFSGQLQGRQISQVSGNDISINYAFLSRPLYTDETSVLTGRIGRIRSSFGFYNETRDFPHTRTGVLMPQSIYYDQTRNSFYSADGIELHWSKSLGENTLGFQLFYSKPVVDINEAQEAAGLGPSNLKGDKSLLAKISFGSEFEGWRAAITYYRPEYTIDLNPIDPTIGQIYADNSSFYSENIVSSLEYNQFDWSVTAEYSRHHFNPSVNLDWDRTVTNSLFLQALPNDTAREGVRQATVEQIKYLGYEESFYLQGIYRWCENFESYLRYDYNTVRGSSWANPASHFVDINVGHSWRPDSNWLVRGELHYIDGWSRLLNRDNQDLLTRHENGEYNKRYWTAAMLQIAYRW